MLKLLSPFAGSGLGQAMKTIPCGFCISHSQTVNSRSFTALQGLCKVLRESKEEGERVQERRCGADTRWSTTQPCGSEMTPSAATGIDLETVTPGAVSQEQTNIV